MNETSSTPRLRWQTWRINRSFLDRLYKEYGPLTEIPLAAAYRVYLQHHWQRNVVRRMEMAYGSAAPVVQRMQKEYEQGDEWMQMNVRNHLAAAAYRHIIIRVRPGVYKFTDTYPATPQGFFRAQKPLTDEERGKMNRYRRLRRALKAKE